MTPLCKYCFAEVEPGQEEDHGCQAAKNYHENVRLPQLAAEAAAAKAAVETTLREAVRLTVPPLLLENFQGRDELPVELTRFIERMRSLCYRADSQRGDNDRDQCDAYYPGGSGALRCWSKAGHEGEHYYTNPLGVAGSIHWEDGEGFA